jgi:hypothetical protein
MSDSDGGFGFGSIFFWIVMLNMFGFCGGDDEKTTEVVVDDKPSMTEHVKEALDEIKPEIEIVVKKAKESFDDVKKDVKKQMSEEETPKKTEEKYDSVYGNNDDKW